MSLVCNFCGFPWCSGLVVRLQIPMSGFVIAFSSLDKKLGSASTLSTQMYKILGTNEILLCVTPSWRGSVEEILLDASCRNQEKLFVSLSPVACV